jgi:DNA-binding transcriptional MerR regulator
VSHAHRRKPALPVGLTVQELALRTHTTPRGIRFYVASGLIDPPQLRGRHTRYSELQAQTIELVQKLQREEGLALEAIRERIVKLTPAEISAMVRPSPPPAPPPPTPLPEPPSPPVPVALPPPVAEAKPLARPSWERLEILPGLEIHVRSDASPHVRSTLREIERQFLESADAAT